VQPRIDWLRNLVRRALGPRHLTVRAHLVILVVGAVVPVVVFSVFAVGRFAGEARSGIQQRLRVTAEGLAAAADKEFAKSIAALEVLAGSPALQRDDIRAFYAEARRARASLGWGSVVLIAADGRQLFNLNRPLGAPLPSVADRRYFVEVVRTLRPVVSDLAQGPVTGRWSSAIAVPVVRDSTVTYVLAAVWYASDFGPLIGRADGGTEWTRALVDRSGVIAARSRAAAEFVGRRATPDFLDRIAQSAQGFYTATTIDGAHVYGAFARAPLSGWTAAVAVPAATVESALWRSVAVTALTGLGLLAVGVLAALFFGRRIATSITDATAAAEALALGRAVSVPASSVTEVRRLGAALEASARLLTDRQMQRADALRREREARVVEAEARQEAERANRGKDEFLAMLAHELRNPVAAITTAAAVLERVDASVSVAAKSRAIVKRQAKQLKRLVDDLLDVGRLASGKLALSRVPVDLAAAVGRSLTIMEATGRFERHVVRFERRSVWVHADPGRLEQILTNLLVNAVKFTPEGGAIRVTVGPEDGAAILRVADTGIGIPAELLPRVFDPFVQGDRPGHGPGGLGVGLMLVRQLAELHGGSVEARSAGAAQGSEFIVTFPVIAPPGRDSRDEPALAPRARRRVLIVEDDADGREALRTLLELAGHEVHEAADGHGGLRAALDLRPDVAFIDVGLPGLDGLDVARALTANDGPRPRLVALTGYGQPEDQRRARDAGFDEHLTKPVDPDELLGML
jgi:signal transduction histidine kinase/CheY-like chemotaxis protein